MRRIEYKLEDITTLKKEYLQIFDKERSEMQKLWEPLRDKLRKKSSKPDLYKDNIDDILIADFDFLAKLYCDFTKLVETKQIRGLQRFRNDFSLFQNYQEKER